MIPLPPPNLFSCFSLVSLIESPRHPSRERHQGLASCAMRMLLFNFTLGTIWYWRQGTGTRNNLVFSFVLYSLSYIIIHQGDNKIVPKNISSDPSSEVTLICFTCSYGKPVVTMILFSVLAIW